MVKLTLKTTAAETPVFVRAPSAAAETTNEKSTVFGADILRERAARLREWVARPALLPETPRRLLGDGQGALLDAAVFLLADRVSSAPNNPAILILERGGLPPVLLDTENGAWRCSSYVIGGRSILSMTCWVRDCDPIAGFAFLYIALHTAPRWRS